jgi:AcrR family transcriptional regulator
MLMGMSVLPGVTDMPREIKMVQRRSFETRNRIINAAMELMAEFGYFSVTTNEIARRAKVSIGSLYSHFSDKKALMLACMEYYHELVKSSISTDSLEQVAQQDAASAIEHDDTLIPSIRSAIESVFAAHRIMPEFYRAVMAACLQDDDIRELDARQHDDSRQRILNLLQRWETVITAPNIPLAADMVYLLISETVHRYMNGDMPHDESLLVDELTSMTKAYLLS